MSTLIIFSWRVWSLHMTSWVILRKEKTMTATVIEALTTNLKNLIQCMRTRRLSTQVTRMKLMTRRMEIRRKTKMSKKKNLSKIHWRNLTTRLSLVSHLRMSTKEGRKILSLSSKSTVISVKDKASVYKMRHYAIIVREWAKSL
jgi:hypothetical protein